MNTDRFSFRRFWLVLRWQFAAGWRTLATLAAGLCLVMILLSGLIALGVFGQQARENIVDVFGSFAAGIFLGVVFVGGVKASEHIRDKNRRREMLMMPAREAEKALGTLLFYIPVLPLTAFVGLKAGVLAFRGIVALLPSALGCADISYSLSVGVTLSGVDDAVLTGVTNPDMGAVSGILIMIWWSTASLFAGMCFRKVYWLFAILLSLVQMCTFPILAVVADEGLMDSHSFVLTLLWGMSLFWSVVNLWLSYRIFRRAEVAERGLVRKMF